MAGGRAEGPPGAVLYCTGAGTGHRTQTGGGGWQGRQPGRLQALVAGRAWEDCGEILLQLFQCFSVKLVISSEQEQERASWKIEEREGFWKGGLEMGRMNGEWPYPRA